MIHFRFLTAIIVLFIFSETIIVSQSKKADKLYEYYKSINNAKVQTLSKDVLSIGLSFVKNNEPLKELVSNVESIKIMTFKSQEPNIDIENRLPGKKMTFSIEGESTPITIWVKKNLFKVKEAHFIWGKSNSKTVISAYGNFRIKDIKHVNNEFIQKGGLNNIPMLGNRR